MRITVSAGFHDRKNCPVTFDAPGLDASHNYALVTPAGDSLPAYLNAGKLTFILPQLFAGETLVLDIVKSASGTPLCSAVDDGVQVNVTVGGRAYTAYYYGDQTPKPYLGPLYGPYGEQVTRLNFDEKEHKHHRSLWFSHGLVNGEDTWGEREGNHGYIRNQSIADTVASDVLTSFTAKNIWTAGDGKPLLDDVTVFTFYNTPASACIFDASLTLTANYGDVTLGATKEGGPLAVRVNYNMVVPKTGRFENGYGGVNEKEVWMSRAPWCDYYGTEDGHTVGVAILDCPTNPRYPCWWHARDYGLMAANVFNLGGDMIVKAGESVRFDYRVCVHAGTTAQAGIAAKFNDFAAPPEVCVE